MLEIMCFWDPLDSSPGPDAVISINQLESCTENSIIQSDIKILKKVCN